MYHTYWQTFILFEPHIYSRIVRIQKIFIKIILIKLNICSCIYVLMCDGSLNLYMPHPMNCANIYTWIKYFFFVCVFFNRSMSVPWRNSFVCLHTACTYFIICLYALHTPPPHALRARINACSAHANIRRRMLKQYYIHEILLYKRLKKLYIM